MTDFTFVKETADGWIYEGLAIPYGGITKDGQDLTGSHFTAKSDLCLDWFPDGGRPLLYRHGFDPTLKAAPVGREIGAVREDSKGRWYQIQIDRAKEYAAEVKQLVDEGLLSLSSGAVDHLAKIAAKTGEIQMWPWVELSLVPNPANPEALFYPVKSADAIEHLTIVDTIIPDAIKDDEPEAEPALEPEADPEVAEEPAETETPEVEDLPAVAQAPEVLAIREGRRNSTSDMNTIQSIHDATCVLGAKCAMEKDAPPALRLVITGTAAAKSEPDLSELKATMTTIATARAREVLHIG